MCCVWFGKKMKCVMFGCQKSIEKKKKEKTIKFFFFFYFHGFIILKGKF